MGTQPLNKAKVVDLIADIEAGIAELRAVTDMSREQFIADKKTYALAEHYLRRTLEGILTIGTHIASRLNGKARDYQEIIMLLGEHGIITVDFAERNKILPMEFALEISPSVGLRNLIVHKYGNVDMKRMVDDIKNNLGDYLQYLCLLSLHEKIEGNEV